ncbi:MAG: radical SAM family heme chaperone HemW [Dysgonamonadaceae bacterium]|nr:radical SAM family heme chaperone HemW [Dysgonamonadaceae bacterium]
MAGIYLHIPFCKTRCIYCDFYSGTNEREIDAFTDALCVEAALRKKEIGDERVETIYFGGGTPSRLQKKHFVQIFEALSSEYQIAPDAEITLEANPDDLSDNTIGELRTLPFNRISIGIQSFDDDELKFLSRRHTAGQAENAVKACRKAGFENISIDLMYGLPRQSLELWQRNIDKAIELNIPHISAYHLIYEEKTRLYLMRKAGKIQPVDEETSNCMFSLLIENLTKNGFTHYEISNFARDGWFSRHNLSYWQGKDYLGLGPAAHSFTRQERSWNPASLKRYIEAMASGTLYRETESLSKEERYNEFILTGLRTVWGVDLQLLEKRFGQELRRYAIDNAQKFIDAGLLTVEKNVLKLSREGLFISDGIMSELMWV